MTNKHESLQQHAKQSATAVTDPTANPLATPTSALQRAYADPRTITSANIEAVQRAIGNRAVGQLLRPPPPRAQRQEEEEELQAKGDPMLAGGELSGDVETAVHSAKSGGRPLDDQTRQPMEQAFNADFSGVKIHTGGEADGLNRAMSARAFTSGQDVFFRSGEYNPGSSAGQELLAHELTHTIQQNNQPTSLQRNTIQRYTLVPVAKQKQNYWQGLGADLRVSDDGKMVVKHTNGVPQNSPAYQDFYATPDIIQHSAGVLQNIGSAFTIAQGGSTLIGKSPSAWFGENKTLYKADIVNQDLARTGKGAYTFNACSANLSHFLGVLRTEVDNPERLEQRRQVILKLEGALDHDQQSINLDENMGDAMITARQIATNSESSPQARAAYNNLNESMRKLLSEQYGINENALPDVGEGWGILQGGEGGNVGYGHFAPVIAQSGPDRVTLENDVSQDTGREGKQMGPINPHWYMRMFGPVKKGFFSDTDQTFWGEAKENESDDYGSRPLVVRIGSQAPQNQENED